LAQEVRVLRSMGWVSELLLMTVDVDVTVEAVLAVFALGSDRGRSVTTVGRLPCSADASSDSRSALLSLDKASHSTVVVVVVLACGEDSVVVTA
jgi:hypothetical protein